VPRARSFLPNGVPNRRHCGRWPLDGTRPSRGVVYLATVALLPPFLWRRETVSTFALIHPACRGSWAATANGKVQQSGKFGRHHGRDNPSVEGNQCDDVRDLSGRFRRTPCHGIGWNHLVDRRTLVDKPTRCTRRIRLLHHLGPSIDSGGTVATRNDSVATTIGRTTSVRIRKNGPTERIGVATGVGSEARRPPTWTNASSTTTSANDKPQQSRKIRYYYGRIQTNDNGNRPDGPRHVFRRLRRCVDDNIEILVAFGLWLVSTLVAVPGADYFFTVPPDSDRLDDETKP
jgi:hypothetical protein